MNFSINIPYGLNNWELFFEILYPEYFDGVELPADYLGNQKLPALLRKNKQRVVNVVELMEPSLVRNAALQDDFVKNDIFEYLNKIIIKKRRFSIESFLIDLGFSPNTKVNTENNLRLNLLKKFAYSVYKKDCMLTIPVYINSEFDLKQYSECYYDIIQKSMFHKFKLSLNIAPHDLKKAVKPKDIYESFRFDMSNIRLLYEPDTGNYITENIFKYWFESLAEFSFSGNIILVPKTKNDYIYENEIKKLTTIIENVKCVLPC